MFRNTKIPFLGDNIQKSYSQELNKIIGTLDNPWKSYPAEYYPELFLSPKGMNLNEPFEGIEFVKLNSQREGNFLQIDFYWEYFEKNAFEEMFSRKYEKLKKDGYTLILVKPVISVKDVISELEYISNNYEINLSSKNFYPEYN